MRRISNQAGDTIVEVMLAIAIVGLVLGASYATATRALRTGRFAQEQTEALKLAESQIEKIKYIAGLDVSKNPPNIFDASTPASTVFCVADGATANAAYKKILTTAETPANECKNINGLYTLLIKYDAAAQDTFTVNVTWDRQATDVQGIVQVAYKLHK